MKLISGTKFLLERYEAWENDNNPDLQASARYIYSTSNYAKLLEKYLKLEMFVPCDEDYNVFIEPNILDHRYSGIDINDFEPDLKEYQQAKEKVLFEGWYFDAEADNFIYLKNKDLMLIFDKLSNEFELISNYFYIIETVEDLAQFNLTLNQSAINKFEL